MTDIQLPPPDEIQRVVRELAIEQPDFIYPRTRERVGCFYNLTDFPDDHDSAIVCRCVVGEALHRLGVSEPDLTKLSEHGGWESVRRELELDGTPADDWIELVQYYQDNLEPWSKAVELADGEHDA